MVTSAFMRHFVSQHRVRQAVTHAAKWAATYAVPVSLSLGVSSLGAIALAPAPALAQSGITLLTNGDQGETVARLQQRLAELGFFAGEATGFYGPLTEEAVILYQNDRGLLADGVAGPETLGTLLPSQAPQSPSIQLNGSQLQNLQAKLSRLGFYLGGIDGVYGPQTEAAINSFQNKYALPVTGVTDDRTLAAVDRIYNQAIGSTISVGSSTTQSFPTAVTTQTQISTTSVSLPPAIPSGPTLVASIPQTTQISSPLPPPSLPNGQPSFGNGNFGNGNFGNGNFDTLPPLGGNNQPIRQTPQVAAAPEVRGYPYIVAVPVKTGGTLSEVRKTAANAFLAGSKRGTYIQAGAYNSREDAERATQILRDRRLDARVVYRPN